MKTGVDVDGIHFLPGFFSHGEHMIGFLLRRRRAMHKVGHQSDVGPRVGQQRIAASRLPRSPTHGLASSGRGEATAAAASDILAYVGKYSSDTFSDQGLGDGATDAISRAGDKCYSRDGSNGLFRILMFVNPTDVARTVAML